MEPLISPIALLIPLVGVYSFFRLSALKELLIGQGQAILSNITDPNFIEENKGILSNRQLRRLQDDIYRKNVYGIEEGIINATINELQRPNKSNTGYYNHVMPMFIRTKQSFKTLVILSISTLSILFITLLFIIIKILISYYCESDIGVTDVIFLIMIALAFFLTISLIFYSIVMKGAFEKNKNDLCKKLRKDNPEIDRLYHSP
jgi:hypothetical protein